MSCSAKTESVVAFSEMVSNFIEGENELETAVDYLHATSEHYSILVIHD